MDENAVDYAPSDLDIRRNMSNDEIDMLIDSLCSTRSENSDVVMMDNIINSRVDNNYNPYLQEKYEVEQDRIAIENDILKSIFEGDTTNIDIEEYNILKANGIYDKYIQSKNNNTIDMEDDIMKSIENEIKQSLDSDNTIEEITEVIGEEEVIENNDDAIFQEPITDEEHIDSSETEDSSIIEGTIEQNIEPIIGGNEEMNKNVMKLVTGLPTIAASMADYSTETDVSEEEVIDINTSDDDGEMSIEEFNDVPATEISIPDNVLIDSLKDQYNDVSTQEAMQLIDVINRYKAHEKFNVFEALPQSIKSIILKEAAEMGADKSTINFFAKSFINDLVNNTFLDKEIKDFNAELEEALAPMGNFIGAVMDEYNDEVYEKFTTKLREKAEEIKESDPDKANQIITISENFEQAVRLERVIDTITKQPPCINRAYKTARDNWNTAINKYNEAISHVNPKPRDLEICLEAVKKYGGFPEEYAKTIIILIKNSILCSIEKNTLEEHVHAYYLSNALYELLYTNKNSKVVGLTIDSLNKIYESITGYMMPLKARRNKKNRKKNKKN